ncbi:MAG TPA: type II secretion system F family protein [Armatimonadota bacterium]|jgi:hypothetical protein
MAEGAQEISNAEMANMCRQFATLLTAQVNILEIFSALREGTDNQFLREALYSVQDAVEMGRSLATAFSRYPGAFSPFFISMLRQGELEGELDKVMEELAQHFESRVVADVDAYRRPEQGSYDLESVAANFQWAFNWLVGLMATVFLGAGLVYYATADSILPGQVAPNMIIWVGVVLLLGIVVFAAGRRRYRRRS